MKPYIAYIYILIFMFTLFTISCKQVEKTNEAPVTAPQEEISKNTTTPKHYAVDDLKGVWQLNDASQYIFKDSIYIFKNHSVERLRQNVKMVANCEDTSMVATSNYFLLYSNTKGSGYTCYEIKKLTQDSLVLSYMKNDSATLLRLKKIP